MRLGTRTALKRRWTPQAHRPKAPVRIGYQFCYLYATLCPFTGQAFAMLMPSMSKDCFGLFLHQFDQQLSEQHPLQRTLLIADRASTHRGKLTANTAITLAHLPTACPERNPVERFFKEMRRHLANTVFNSLEHAQNQAVEVFNQLTQSAEKIRRLTLFPYIQNAHS
jgi:transposase